MKTRATVARTPGTPSTIETDDLAGPRAAEVLAEATDFPLRGDHITLEALLKAGGVALGGAAKALIAQGDVRVNGQAEARRGRKLRSGDEVAVGAQRLRVVAPTAD